MPSLFRDQVRILSGPVGNSAHARAAEPVFTDGVSRRELFFWLACILFANQLVALPVEPHGGLTALAQSLLSRSIFYYFGWYVVINLLLASQLDLPASRLDVGTALAIALLNFVPVLSSGWLATTAAGLFWLAAGRSDTKLKAAAVVLLALAFNGYWGPKLFNVFAYYILRADAALVGAALVATQPGMSWQETVVGHLEGHSVLIFGPCSSFHNLSLGLLCWVSINKLVRASWARADLAVALAVCVAMILLNATRLYLMALSSDHYAYWHGGTGEVLFAWASTIMVLSISLWGAVRLGRRG